MNNLENSEIEKNFLSMTYIDEIPTTQLGLISIPRFKEACRDGHFIDWDGFGYLVKDGKMNGAIKIYPSKLESIPDDATHIVWVGR